ncbi:MAG: hypothetical protein NT066_06595 [Candidatus Omnitrophica bacterium]|nr:hypothetical protein [Candidatus Omnitrophota bacterium]
MRSLVIALAVVALMFGFAYADQTSGATYTSPNGKLDKEFIDFLNNQQYLDHSHDIDLSRDPEMGLGVDLVLWQNENVKPVIEEVVLQGKYDIQNEESSGYLVARINLFNWTKKKAVEKPVETAPATEPAK